MPNPSTEIPELMTKELQSLQPIILKLLDDSELHRGHAGAATGGGHYRLHLVSPLFEQQSRVKRHQMVYNTLAGMMRARQIHALSMELLAPSEQKNITACDTRHSVPDR